MQNSEEFYNINYRIFKHLEITANHFTYALRHIRFPTIKRKKITLSDCGHSVKW